MSNSIHLLLLGITTSILTLIPDYGWTRPKVMEMPVKQTEYLAQNLASKKISRFKGKGKRLLEQLNLSTTQQEGISKIKQTYQPQISQIKDNLESEKDKLAEMMTNGESTANLRTQHQKIIVLNQQIHNLRFESMLEMLAILTPEQRQEFAKMMSEKRKNSHRSVSK